MTTITDTMRTVAGDPDNSEVVFFVPELRPAASGTATVTMKRVSIAPTNGNFSVSLDPGLVYASLSSGRHPFVVPASGTARMGALIAQYLPPSTTPTQVEAAIANWLDENPLTSSTAVDDLKDASAIGKSVAKAANAAAIRTLIDAATPAQVSAAVNAVVNAAPGTLDTLDELAQALGDDPNFATTITGLIGAKYGKPVNGIPASDLVQAVRDSLGKADSALQPTAADLRYVRTVNAVGPDANGNVTVASGGTGQADTVDTLGLTGATGRAVMKAADAATARTAIGAGTSNLELGTTASTAKAGDYQPAATAVVDLTEFIQDTVAGLLKAGTNVTTAYDDAANTFTIDATAIGGGTTDPEVVRDTIGGALVAGSGISVTVNDAADTITIAVAGVPQSAVSGLTTSLATLQTNIDAKYTKPSTGIPKADLDPAAQSSLELAGTASQPGHAHSVSEFTATGTRDGTTFLRGDNTWATPPSSSSSEESNVTRLLSYGAGGLNSGVDWPQAGTDRGFRRIVSLPCKTTRYRHKIRNFNTTSNTSASGFESNGAAALVGAGMVEGVAAFDSLGMPNGNFQGGVGNTQMPSGYAIPNNGSFYVGPWITDPAQQFSPDVPKVFATGWTAGASVNVNVMTERVFKYTNAAAAINPATTGGVSGNNNGPGIGASSGNGVSGMPLDWLIEYETADTLPAVLFITDSLGEGVTGPGNAAKSTAASQVLADAYYAYPMRFGMQEKVHVTNLGLMNSTTAQWGHATLTDRWTRTDIFAGKYDAIVIALGSNDASLSTSLASFQTQMAAVVARARQYVGAGAWVPLYFVNITPRGFGSGSTQENARLAYNNWFSQLPFNAKGVVDLDSVMGTPNANTMRAPLHIDGAHYSYQGSDMAAAATSATLIPSGR